ncbi:Zn-dependent alcohol dehydrogenase [uncultured Sphingomonas sp.]|uniref:Zn-dependent alcohol dehydrogenase n=1 Tax=uncultured Sphingomonas sp. TaxID=158754 RepID=UPI002619C38E|nr:Zn-dependent alcohol dehydrogenase [uncultured Sphingomonas sp.]
MRAAVLRDTGAPMTIEDVAIARPGAREVLVRVAAVGLCHSDLHVLTGDIPFPRPAVLGHEAAGIVEAVGSAVQTVKPGDHVIGLLAFNCGHCEQCHGGHTHRCYPAEAARTPGEPARLSIGGEAIAQGWNMGAFAELMLLHESGVVPIRRDMPFDRACVIGCGVTTGLGAVINAAKVRPGESIAVIGCGGVGLSAINGAAISGAGRIIAIDRVSAKLALARSFGATDTIDASHGDLVAQVMALTNGRGVDHAIEAIGLKTTIEAAFDMLAKGGLATVVGAPRADVRIELPAAQLLREKRLQGSMMGGVRKVIDVPRYVDWYLDGRLKLDDLVAERIALSDINRGFDHMRGGGIARSVIIMDS